MKITNCKDPEMVSYLAPWFVPTGQSIVEICAELKDRLKKNPEDTLCLVFSEKKKCQAVLVAYKADDCVWVWQYSAKSGFLHSKVGFELMKKWAVFLGVKEIRAKATKRLARFFKRKFNFKRISGDLIYELR